MNEEYLYEVGQEVWVLFADTRTVRVGKILQCSIYLDEFSRTVTYTLQNGNKTFTALESEVYLEAPLALEALLAEMEFDMPTLLREYDIGQIVWFVNIVDNSLHTGEVISAHLHVYSQLSGPLERTLYRIYDGDDYYTVSQEYVGATAQEASAILEQLLDSYEC